jgi:hypothetical protein
MVSAPANSNPSSPSPPPEAPNESDQSTDAGDQDIDTAATNAYDEFASERGDVNESPDERPSRLADGDAPDNDGKPIGLHDPSSMPRAEDDETVRRRSPEFHDRPGSGKYR